MVVQPIDFTYFDSGQALRVLLPNLTTLYVNSLPLESPSISISAVKSAPGARKNVLK
jgi:hypothetical protein